MKKLILIPIVHTPADMGSMKETLKQLGIKKLGEKKWEENLEKIKEFWNKVEAAIDKLDLDYSRVRIFQDGMPCSGELAIKIVNETAAKGSRNYQIIKKMIEKGAKIEETESRELLLKEYDYVKEFTEAESKDKKTEALKKYEEAKDGLIKERDEFIANKINSVLKNNELGFLFIGARHNVKAKLASDIKVEELD
ncbi:MAG: hypothetical protein KJ968_05560 [Nanoarchaeota archaeon]|nr:hypothetical protein [Nanoarchaeota archaeon]